MPSVRFLREVEVRIDGEAITKGLRVSFRVERLPFDAYAVCKISIYNLNKKSSSTDKNSEIKEGSSIELIAGYKESSSRIFIGTIHSVEAYRDDLDSITNIYSSDNAKIRDPIVSLTRSNSTDMSSLISDIAFSVGIEIAELDIEGGNIEGSITYNKRFSSVMNDLADTAQFSWYIYNLELYVFGKEKTSERIYEISAETGMLEPPILTGKGINVKMLLEPLIRVRDRYKVKSSGLQYAQGSLEVSQLITFGNGEQIVASIIHTGDTHSSQWYTEIEGIRNV